MDKLYHSKCLWAIFINANRVFTDSFLFVKIEAGGRYGQN